MTADLVIRGGTVVTVAGTARADVAIEGERIVAVGDMDPGQAEVIDATGLLVLPGVVDVHTHTRIASDTEPDRFFQDSVAAAFGGTTTFLSFNNPGTGISADGARSLLAGMREWRAATEGDSAVDIGLSAVITAQQDDPVAELPALIGAGVPTFKAFMVYDFAIDDRTLLDALAVAQRSGGMLQVHCENAPILDAHTARLIGERCTEPRFHAQCRPPYVEAEAVGRVAAYAHAVEARSYAVHLSSAAALDAIRAARSRGIDLVAETCPHYLALTEERYGLPDEEAIRYVISPPLRAASDRDALWDGLRDGSISVAATDHVPDRLDREKRWAGQPFPDVSNGAPGIETLLAVVYSEGVAAGRLSLERMVDVLSTTPARLFGLGTKGAIELGKDADVVLFDPAARRTLRAADLHHTSDYSPYEGMRIYGAVRRVLVRGRTIVEGDRFVGERGYGRFQERRLATPAGV